jgi:hypothetical protein
LPLELMMRLSQGLFRRELSLSSRRPVVPQLHELSCALVPKVPATILAALLVDAGFKSFEVATPVPSYAQPHDKVLPALRYKPELGLAAIDGQVDVHGLSIDLPFGSTNKAADEKVSHVLSVVEKAHKRSIPTRVTLVGALTVDEPRHVQRMASDLARDHRPCRRGG